MTGMAEDGFLADPAPIAFAHRGFAAGPARGAENSMAAFEQAVALGYRYLETDVRVTADGVALAFHDARLDRVTDRTGVVAELPYAEVKGALIGGLEPIPLLTDVLAAGPEVRINIDVKSDPGIAPTVQAIRHTGALHRVCIGAFATRRIVALRRALGPRLVTSLGPREVLALKTGPRVLRRRLTGRCAQVPARLGRARFVDARFVAAAHRAGIAVHVWTVNDATDMTRLLDLGVDGIMTDRADVLRDLLIARGQWRR
jgi:glycerophosphoryl diester phosphodiesterase